MDITSADTGLFPSYTKSRIGLICFSRECPKSQSISLPFLSAMILFIPIAPRCLCYHYTLHYILITASWLLRRIKWEWTYARCLSTLSYETNSNQIPGIPRGLPKKIPLCSELWQMITHTCKIAWDNMLFSQVCWCQDKLWVVGKNVCYG